MQTQETAIIDSYCVVWLNLNVELDLMNRRQANRRRLSLRESICEYIGAADESITHKEANITKINRNSLTHCTVTQGHREDIIVCDLIKLEIYTRL